MRSYRKIDDRTMEFAAKKGGKVTITGRIVVAPDGKTRSVAASGLGSKGDKLHNTSIFNKVGQRGVWLKSERDCWSCRRCGSELGAGGGVHYSRILRLTL